MASWLGWGRGPILAPSAVGEAAGREGGGDSRVLIDPAQERREIPGRKGGGRSSLWMCPEAARTKTRWRGVKRSSPKLDPLWCFLLSSSCLLLLAPVYLGPPLPQGREGGEGQQEHWPHLPTEGPQGQSAVGGLEICMWLPEEWRRGWMACQAISPLGCCVWGGQRGLLGEAECNAPLRF